MTSVNHALHEAIGALASLTTRTITSASRAAAHPTELEGFWLGEALERIGEHRRALDRLENELRALAV